MKRIGAAALALAALLALLLRVSPRPTALFYRRRFDANGLRRSLVAAAFVPDGVTTERDVPYRPGDRDALLDIHRPSAGGEVGPTIVWVHGGAWLSGDKAHIANFLRVLAAGGYTVVGVGYSIAPEARYPTPVRQVLDALGYLTSHAQELGIDPTRLILAGDSAGAQIAAQVTGMITNRDYASSMQMRPPVTAAQVVGTVFFCGAYDMSLIRPLRGRTRWFVDSIMWAFTGTTGYLDDPRFAGLSVVAHVTADFPTTFLACGGDDPMMAHQYVMADTLDAVGVPHETHVAPRAGHQFQFDLETPAAQDAMVAVHAFVATLDPSRRTP
ncbi:alpha/beta hydrolase [Cellulomonas sp. URHD0024]|uniref:alpha/beta hydrolase n=1 Tax=Cellulomonas sp. URHD0024 TaxID=1302620 RepID=UPI0003FD3BEE|nr:alpha/beta hydrolase [Cellulomonas sp. URHD0024]